MLMHCFWINIYLTNPPSPAPTNDSSVCLQTTLSGCAQTTLTALAKRQFGGLERHLCHTLDSWPKSYDARANLCSQKENKRASGIQRKHKYHSLS